MASTSVRDTLEPWFQHRSLCFLKPAHGRQLAAQVQTASPPPSSLRNEYNHTTNLPPINTPFKTMDNRGEMMQYNRVSTAGETWSGPKTRHDDGWSLAQWKGGGRARDAQTGRMGTSKFQPVASFFFWQIFSRHVRSWLVLDSVTLGLGMNGAYGNEPVSIARGRYP